ncbi:hypothetical protein RAMLITH_10705 [Ramlibacter sp. RBP-2]|uniref:Uncharacterized protein n=1 Tax=Ramlibacter lithotrophicus TaxID=2606681 RepID=A0A7X6I6E8_9BURK|nr:hypothetical protein [Ramlibacter lithotrophicus]NKE66291.1 hypothetical protein [Ramlibacter lithotrophicus]
MITSEQAQWHRQTAIECNNRAWELTVLPRTEGGDREMLDAAHTSAWHWARVGTELNRMRATMLVAAVHALLGHGATALPLAIEMRGYFLARSDTPDWELAMTHAVYAHAAHAAGEVAAHSEAHRQATAALAAIADDEDRRIVARTLELVPQP